MHRRLIELTMMGALVGTAGCGSDDVAGDTATVTVRRGGQPVAGVDVLAHDATGALTLETTTDASGVASVAVTADAMVTVVDMSSDGTFLQTVTAVAPGDQVAVTLPPATPQPAGMAIVTLPGSITGSNPVYRVGVGFCGEPNFTDLDPSTPITIPLLSPCVHPDGTITVIAKAMDGLTPNWSQYTAMRLPVAGATTAVTLPAWRSDITSHTASVTNALPAMIARLEREIDGVQVDLDVAPVIAGGDASLRIPDVGAGPTVLRVSATKGMGDTTELVEPVEIASAWTVDAARLLPSITRSQLLAEAGNAVGFDWDEPDGIAGTDAFEAFFGDAQGRFWFLVAPPTAVSPVSLPALPARLAGARPSPSFVQVGYVDHDSVDGYEDVKAGVAPAPDSSYRNTWHTN